MPKRAESVSKTAEEIINVFDVITKKGDGSATARIAQLYAVEVADCNRIRTLVQRQVVISRCAASPSIL